MSERRKKGEALAGALRAWVESCGGYAEAHAVRKAVMRASRWRLSGPVVQDLTTGRYLSWHGGEALDLTPRVKVRLDVNGRVSVWRWREGGRAWAVSDNNYRAAALDILAA